MNQGRKEHVEWWMRQSLKHSSEVGYFAGMLFEIRSGLDHRLFEARGLPISYIVGKRVILQSRYRVGLAVATKGSCVQKINAAVKKEIQRERKSGCKQNRFRYQFLVLEFSHKTLS